MDSIREVAHRLAAVERQVSTMSAPRLAHSSVHDGVITVVESVPTLDPTTGQPTLTAEGLAVARHVPRMTIGSQPDGTTTVGHLSGPKPPAPAPPGVMGSARFARASWDGNWADALGRVDATIPAPMDLARVQVHIGPTATFTPQTGPESATLRGTIETAAGGTVTILLDPGQHYIRLVAISKAGVAGSPSGARAVIVSEIVTTADADALRAAISEAKGQATAAMTSATAAAAAAEAAAATARASRTVADSALALADGKSKVYRQEEPPDKGITTGDLWVKASTNLIHRWSGQAWEPLVADAAAALKTGTISAELLAAQIVLVSTLVAGKLSDNHVTLDAAGLRSWMKTPDGQVVEAIRLGSGSGPDFLQVYSSTTGQVVAGINQNGGLTARTADIGNKAGDVLINGRRFEDHLAPYPRGIIAWGKRATVGGQVYQAQAKWLEVQTTLSPGRLYRVTLNPLYVKSTATDSSAVLALYASSGGEPATMSADQQIQSSILLTGPAGSLQSTSPLVAIINTAGQAAPKEWRFLSSYNSFGPGYVTVETSAMYPSIMTVEDVGPAIADVGIDYGQSAPPTTRRTYSTYWQATTTVSYRGDGTRRTDTTDLVQGYNSYNGIGSAIALFGGQSYDVAGGGETGRTIAEALAGATITSASVYLHAGHWWYNSGGQAAYAWTNLAAAPATLPTQNLPGRASWSGTGGQYIPLSEVRPDITGILLGIASQDLTYYGRFSGASSSAPPVLRIDYTR